MWTTDRRRHARRPDSASVRRPRWRPPAFTAVEGLIASIILAMSAVAIAAACNASYQQNEALDEGTTALALARQLMEEIASKPYTAAASGMPGQRGTFVSLKDYATLWQPESSSDLKAIDGVHAIDVGSGPYTRNVSVEYRNTPGGPAVASGNFALVTVTVTDPRGRQVRLWQLFSNAVVWQQ